MEGDQAPEEPLTISARLVLHSHRDGNWEIYSSADDGSAQQRLTVNGADDIEPRLSYHSDRVVFSSNRSGSFQIYSMRFDGSDVRQITSGFEAARRPAWSPDSKKIAFQGTQSGNTDVYVIGSDGAGLVRLTNQAGYDGEPDWSPDGQQIAFISRRTAGALDYFLYVMNADGSNAQSLSSRPDSANPHWSPDQANISYDYLEPGYFQRLALHPLANGADRALYGPSNLLADFRMNGWGAGGEFYISVEQYDMKPPYAYLGQKIMAGNLAREYTDGAYRDVVGADSGSAHWSSLDRLAPMVEVLGQSQYQSILVSPFVIAYSVDNGAAGVDLVQLQLRSQGGNWPSWSIPCTSHWNNDPYTFYCPLSQIYAPDIYRLRARAVDRDGNVSHWSGIDEEGQVLGAYWHLIYGLVRDGRDQALSQASVSGAPSVEGITLSTTDGRYLVHALDTGSTFTMTAHSPGFEQDWPRSLWRNDFRIPPGSVSDVRLDHWLVGSDNIVPEGDFEPGRSFADWRVSETLPSTVALNDVYIVVRTPYSGAGALKMGWDDGYYSLPVATWGATSQTVTWYTSSGWRGYSGALSGHPHVFECPTAGICSVSELPIGARMDLLAQTTTPDGGGFALIATMPPMAAEPRLYRIDPAGHWTDAGAVPGHSTSSPVHAVLLSDIDGTVHLFWLDDNGTTVWHISRSVGGTWSSWESALPNTVNFAAAMAGPGQPVVLGVTSSAVVTTWSQSIGWSTPQPIAPGTPGSDRYPLLVTDGQGTLTAAWVTGNAASVAAVRKPMGQAWGPVDLLPLSGLPSSIPLLVPGPEGSVAGVTEPVSGQPLSYWYVQKNGTWSAMQSLLSEWPPKWPGNPQLSAINWVQHRGLFARSSYDGYVAASEFTFSPAQDDGFVSRRVDVPAEMWNPTLSFEYEFFGGSSGDQLLLRVVPTVGAPVAQVLSVSSTWTHTWVDLSPWSGQTVTATIELQGDGDAQIPEVYLDHFAVASHTTPTITAVSIDRENGHIDIAGANFMSGVSIWIGDTELTTAHLSDAHLTADFPQSIPLGRQPLSVVNPTGASAHAIGAFGTTQIPLPMIARWSPVWREILFEWTP